MNGGGEVRGGEKTKELPRLEFLTEPGNEDFNGGTNLGEMELFHQEPRCLLARFSFLQSHRRLSLAVS